MTEYNQEIANKILAIISDTGCDSKAYEGVGIDKDDFHQWLREENDFFDQVAKARHIYRENKNHSQVVKAMQVLDEYLWGQAMEVHESDEAKTSGDSETSHKTLTKKVRRSTPAWVIDRVLGKRMHEMEALRVLANAGWIPRNILTEVVDGIVALRESVRKAFEDLNRAS